MRFVFLLAACCWLAAAPDAGAAQSATPAATVAPEPIPVPEISTRAAEVTTRLRQVEEQSQPNPAVEEIARLLPVRRVEIRGEIDKTSQTIASQPALEAATAIAKLWTDRSVELRAWKDTLTSEAQGHESVIDELEDQLAVWKHTGRVLPADTPAVTAERIKLTTTAIREALKAVKHQRGSVLGLQDETSALLSDSEQIVVLAERARVLRIENLFSPDSPKLWEWHRQWADLPQAIGRERSVAVGQARALRDFVTSNGVLIALHFTAIALLAAMLLRARRRVREERAQLGGIVDVTLLELPFSTAVLIGMAVVPSVELHAPRAAYELAGLLALGPVVLLTRRLVDRALYPWLYALAGFYLIDRVRAVIATAPVLEPLLFTAEMLAAVVVAGVFLLPSRLARIEKHIGATLTRTLRVGAIPLLGLFIAAVLATAFGYGQLGRLLGGGTLTSLYAGITLHAARRAFEGVAGYAITSQPAQRIHLFRLRAITVFVQTQRILRWLTLALWVFATLSAFALLDNARATVTAFLALSFTRESFTISVGDVAAFALTVWFSFGLSRFLRFVLEEDVYPRLHVAPGLPYALSRMVHYVVLTGGFFAATAMIGLGTDRLAFLIGAFGVGIGFGLQNIVNNFVSGVILLFERPVQVGDSVQVGDLVGKVERIGIRSSTMRTVTGAEVIIPNANLISDPLTNWTLSDRRRMIQIPVGVAYGTEPTRVIELLEAAARQHPQALDEPPPRALFTGFGESSLDFELRFWTGDFDSWIVTRSEVVLAVERGLREAKIEIPFPQREVRVHPTP